MRRLAPGAVAGIARREFARRRQKDRLPPHLTDLLPNASMVGAFKVGKELFVSAGPEVIRKIRATGASVFLDLKFHDIPNTVARAVEAAARLDVQMLTIHTGGGPEMMKAAET